MIQRIQSVYLLLVVILLAVSAWMPAGTFFEAEGGSMYSFKPLGVDLPDGERYSTWGLFGLLLLGAVVALCTIFLYRNRLLQVRMTMFGSLLLVGYYAVFFVFMNVLTNRLGQVDFQMGWALCLPAVCLILNYLAARAIRRDEALVRSADRLR